ncbi:MAG: SIS domain-containing protein, partial [Alphaproteobacteria bacterium]|nr:SIS domain-containing protein [Alphaproteobacteria bacterium]
MIDFKEDIESYLTKLKNTIDRLSRDEISVFINMLITARDEGRTIFIMGNGGSASTASHFCCDFNKGASYGYDRRFKFICLNDNTATMMAYSNDVAYEDAMVEQLKNFFEPGDYVIGISGSGNSKNVVKAIEY